MMLIEFRVKNFRSLRDEQIFSLVASTDKTLQDSNTFASNVKAAPLLLPSAVIYGANASGKSNLIKALQYMQSVVTDPAYILSSGLLGMEIAKHSAQPFRLDPATVVQPTSFEVSFILDQVRYQYGFALSALRVTSEYLLAYKTNKAQQWYRRTYDEITGKDQYSYSAALKGAKSVWEGATRPNALFLSTAVQLNSEQLVPIYTWFASQMYFLNELTPLNQDHVINMLKRAKDKQTICELMKRADMFIDDINLTTHKRPPIITSGFNLGFGKWEHQEEEQEINEPQFQHTTPSGKAVFGLHEESMGTRNFLYLSGPILEILNHGHTLLVDELDNSLHPLLVKKLVELFHNPLSNPKGAQLIFSTHNTSLLDTNLFRRDQIWFVEKDKDQASTVFPLSDFSPRKNEALEKGYLMGRYGALPFIDTLSE